MSLLYLGDTKRCPRCKKYKLFSEYHSGRCRYGTTSRCKECINSARRRTRGKHDLFWKRYHAQTVKSGECLIWTGRCTRSEPIVQFNKRTIKVSRLVVLLNEGLSDDEYVIRTCNNKKCVRQSHLKKVTYEIFRVKLESAKRGSQNPDRVTRGSSKGSAKLKEEDILIIRDMWRNGVKQTEIASRYGVKSNTINEIVNYVNWKHVQ